jgi:hypothetical protein
MPKQQPSAKTEIIEQLQRSIEQLQTVVESLKTDSVDRLPPQNAIDNLVSTSDRLALSLSSELVSDAENISSLQTRPVATSGNAPSDDSWVTDEEEEDVEGLDRLLPTFGGLQNWWDGILAGIRKFLPRKVNNNLSDWGLTSFLAILVVIALISSVLLLPINPPEFPKDIAENLINQLDDTEEFPPDLSSPDAIANPPELVAPEPPQAIELNEPPALPLTPEQSLIGAIQQEVKDLTLQYPDGLILAIAPNFLASQLTVTLGSDWYDLSPQRQDNFADAIWQRSQKLAFRKLNLLGPTGGLLARSPVVGDQVIVLEREVPSFDRPTL